MTPGERFAAVVQDLAGEPGVAPPDASGSRRSFGSSGLKVQGKLFALLSSRNAFVVKLPRPRVDALTAAGEGEPFDPGHGRRMKEWLALNPASSVDWLSLAREALAYVSTSR